MASVGSILTGFFYALILGAMAFFVHKVLWFVRYRKIQERLVAKALERLREEANTTVVRWDQGADASWSEAALSDQGATPTDYVDRVEAKLRSIEEELRSGHHAVKDLFAKAVVGEEHPESPVQILAVPRLKGPARKVFLALRFAPIPDPEVPDESIFQLEVRSRYGFGRRLLAFVFGAADVVYSSQHVVRMSQDPKVPPGVLLRRISLVLLILLALLVDMGFGIRPRLHDWVEGYLIRNMGMEEGFIRDALSNSAALGLWLVVYGGLYMGLYLFLRWRSGRYLGRLEEMRKHFADQVADIRDQHLQDLDRWAHEYAGTLDDAAALTLNQAAMLVQRSTHRLRRRIASPRLLGLAAEVAVCFFDKLPESSKHLQDVATSHKHSWKHVVWPQPQEMRYQLELAQWRHAWRDIEVCLSTLRGKDPDPELADQLWRSLVRYARMFPRIVPEDLFARLQEAHGETVATLVDATEVDLEELDARLGELADALQRTVDAAGPLVESRIELAIRGMEASVADLASEVLAVRERARLEAMAFEI
ncbi:MAG: hypothetical protein CMN30_16935 [Sandaracinus sp.]|nr:hypothetical protein [Sandaracinus sp.]